jgi:hypothetical protein
MGMLTPFGFSATIYVNGITGDDTWGGPCAVWDGDSCGPKATIQAGINVAEEGDDVVVADGVYTGVGNKNLSFDGKTIHVQSESGPKACIIDCERDGRGFHLQRGETPDAIIDGFTVRNGYVDSEYPNEGCGGGFCCIGSSPRLPIALSETTSLSRQRCRMTPAAGAVYTASRASWSSRIA